MDIPGRKSGKYKQKGEHIKPPTVPSVRDNAGYLSL